MTDFWEIAVVKSKLLILICCSIASLAFVVGVNCELGVPLKLSYNYPKLHVEEGDQIIYMKTLDKISGKLENNLDF